MFEAAPPAAEWLTLFERAAAAQSVPGVLVHHARRSPRRGRPGLGIDDWATRCGHRGGMMLIDIEHRASVEPLPVGEVATAAVWIHAHPVVEVVAGDHAEAARQGAFGTCQVADRWRHLKNVGDLLEQVLVAFPRAVLGTMALPPQVGPPTWPCSLSGNPRLPLRRWLK